MTVLLNTFTNLLSSQLTFSSSYCKLLKQSLVYSASILTILQWNIFMDDRNLDKISLSKWQLLQHHKYMMPTYFYKEIWQTILGFTFSTGDTTHIVYNQELSKTNGIGDTKGHFTHEIESPWPSHVKHSHWWKRRSRSKFASHYVWGTNEVCECKMDVESTWTPTWHPMDHISWSLGLFSRTTSWR